jgi:uncharacterized membrane protein YgaE (UPF0421/DUF939 family)
MEAQINISDIIEEQLDKVGIMGIFRTQIKESILNIFSKYVKGKHISLLSPDKEKLNNQIEEVKEKLKDFKSIEDVWDEFQGFIVKMIGRIDEMMKSNEITRVEGKYILQSIREIFSNKKRKKNSMTFDEKKNKLNKLINMYKELLI